MNTKNTNGFGEGDERFWREVEVDGADYWVCDVGAHFRDHVKGPQMNTKNTNGFGENTNDSGEKRKLTERIIGCAMRVHNKLGIGFLEKVYENALVHELRKEGLEVRQQWPIPVFYDGVVVGDYVADLIVEGKVVVELKTVRALIDEHTSICLNYLRACDLPVCLLMNFAQLRLQVKRLVGDTYIKEPEVL